MTLSFVISLLPPLLLLSFFPSQILRLLTFPAPGLGRDSHSFVSILLSSEKFYDRKKNVGKARGAPGVLNGPMRTN